MSDRSKRNRFTADRRITSLRELISALDRRVPHNDRPGERRISGDAQGLRRQAVTQIEALRVQGLHDTPGHEGLVNAVMTDDGCPSPDVSRAALDPIQWTV